MCINRTLSYIQSSEGIKKTSIKKYPQNIHQKTIGPPPVLNSRRRRTKIHSGILPHTHTHTHTDTFVREWRWAYKSSDQKLFLNDPKHESLHTRFQSGKESIIKKTGARNKKGQVHTSLTRCFEAFIPIFQNNIMVFCKNQASSSPSDKGSKF